MLKIEFDDDDAALDITGDLEVKEGYPKKGLNASIKYKYINLLGEFVSIDQDLQGIEAINGNATGNVYSTNKHAIGQFKFSARLDDNSIQEIGDMLILDDGSVHRGSLSPQFLENAMYVLRTIMQIEQWLDTQKEFEKIFNNPEEDIRILLYAKDGEFAAKELNENEDCGF